MTKIYRKLTADQKARGVIFSSCLSKNRQEGEDDKVHEVFNTASYDDREDTISRLLDDKFFNASHYKYNIVRRGE